MPDDATPKPVTVENLAEADVDARICRFIDEGGMNHGLMYEVPTPTDNQAVPRMNRDTMYAGYPIDTSQGYSITVPEHPTAIGELSCPPPGSVILSSQLSHPTLTAGALAARMKPINYATIPA